MSASKLFSAIILGSILLSTSGSMAGGNPEFGFEDAGRFGSVEGSKSIVLNGGSKGFVAFPHGRHQDMFTDCLPCHDLFPKEAHVADRMMQAGQLKRKDVMNMCKNCHTDLANQGRAAGPTACKGCHKE